MSKYDDLRGWNFEAELRKDMEDASNRLRGEHPAPWDVLLEALIALERRRPQREPE